MVFTSQTTCFIRPNSVITLHRTCFFRPTSIFTVLKTFFNKLYSVSPYRGPNVFINTNVLFTSPRTFFKKANVVFTPRRTHFIRANVPLLSPGTRFIKPCCVFNYLTSSKPWKVLFLPAAPARDSVLEPLHCRVSAPTD